MKKNQKIHIIAAVGENMELGYQNQLLCHLPADLKHFKTLTTGHTIVMGRKTWDSLPIKPLPHRRNIVLTSNPTFSFEGVESASSVETLFSLLCEDETIFIIGGASLYQTFLPYADKLYLTRIQSSFLADTFFPTIDFTKWRLIEEIVQHKDDKNPYSLIFQTYVPL